MSCFRVTRSREKDVWRISRSGGAAILSDLAIPRGEYLALKITFPTQAAVIEIELAPVRWIKPGSFGVEFIRIAPGSQQRLKDYLATLEGAASDAA
jgi:hypothetical protein